MFKVDMDKWKEKLDMDDDFPTTMSPSLLTYSEATILADMDSVVGHILEIAGAERDFTEQGHGRYTWILERAIRYSHRSNKKLKKTG